MHPTQRSVRVSSVHTPMQGEGRSITDYLACRYRVGDVRPEDPVLIDLERSDNGILPAGDRFFVVVPANPAHEGSYGSLPVSPSPCKPQRAAICN